MTVGEVDCANGLYWSFIGEGYYFIVNRYTTRKLSLHQTLKTSMIWTNPLKFPTHS